MKIVTKRSNGLKNRMFLMFLLFSFVYGEEYINKNIRTKKYQLLLVFLNIN